jgi:hypothetical protein
MIETAFTICTVVILALLALVVSLTRSVKWYSTSLNKLVEDNTMLMRQNIRWRQLPHPDMILIRIITDKQVAVYRPGEGPLYLQPGDSVTADTNIEHYIYVENEPWNHRSQPLGTTSGSPSPDGQ